MFAPRALLRLSASVCAPPTHLRLLSTSLPLASKASKARVASRPKNKLPGGSLASVPRGTGVGADPRLYAPDEPVVGRGLFEEEPASRAATTKVEGELLAAQGDAVGARAREVDEGLRGTGVAASTEAYPAGEQVVGRTGADGAVVGGASQAEGPQPEEETIYTANPPFNVPLMMTACVSRYLYLHIVPQVAEQALRTRPVRLCRLCGVWCRHGPRWVRRIQRGDRRVRDCPGMEALHLCERIRTRRFRCCVLGSPGSWTVSTSFVFRVCALC